MWKAFCSTLSPSSFYWWCSVGLTTQPSPRRRFDDEYLISDSRFISELQVGWQGFYTHPCYFKKAGSTSFRQHVPPVSPGSHFVSRRQPAEKNDWKEDICANVLPKDNTLRNVSRFLAKKFSEAFSFWFFFGTKGKKVAYIHPLRGNETMRWRCTTVGGFVFQTCPQVHIWRYSVVRAAQQAVGDSKRARACVFMRACVLRGFQNAPTSIFLSPLFRYHPTFSTAAHSQTRGRKSTQTHAHARQHTHNLCPLVTAKTVSAAILSGHEMTSIRAEWCSCAVAGAADTHGQLCGGRGRSAHYCDLSRFRWNLFPFSNFNTWYGVIWGGELEKPWMDAITGLRMRVSKYTNKLPLQGSTAPWRELAYSEGL